MGRFELNLNDWWADWFGIVYIKIHCALYLSGVIGLGCFFSSHQRQSSNNSF